MITPIPVITGLGGAIGSAFDRDRNRLYFTEFDGKLSRLDLTPPSAVMVRSSDSQTIDGTFSLNLDTGTSDAGNDIFWRQQTSVERQMEPRNGAQLAYLGAVSYAGLSAAELASLTYSPNPINADNNASNLLTNGAVFAVRTTAGNYTKVQVITYGYDMTIRYRTYRIPSAYQVIGTGYTQPEDIALSETGTHAYVTERNGNFLRVDLANADRADATVVASGFTAPHQIALDELRGFAYVPEFVAGGRLLRVDLATGSHTVVATGLENAVGLVLADDSRYAYISEQPAAGGRIRRIDLQSGTKTTVATGLVAPFFLSWSDGGEGGLLFTQRTPANQVSLLDLSDASPVVRHIANVPNNPSSVAVINPYRLYVCCDEEISRLDTDASVFTPTGPIFLGIGHVPADRITDGYADTTGDPEYFYQVRDCPFGGTLPLLLNHTRAYSDGARYYKLLVDGAEPRQSFTDLKWSASNNRFNSQTVNPTSSGYYRIRRPGSLWYNPWLAYRLNTAGISNGMHTLTFQLFATASSASPMGTFSLAVRIDNTLPEASIDNILHRLPDGTNEEINTCGIVNTETDQFQFRITARDAEGHLRSWKLHALWGDNRSVPIDSATYVPNSARNWVGLNNALVPSTPWGATVTGDPTSRRCAHTFDLSVWDRTINGYGYIHHRGYHKSITLLLP
ncbi:hypothetical protein CLV84_1958 [Neolewinella xylanilytica]|uniref:Uncharacterized protein n=1 Tax=Neolewinella xylanilytica TaxID=1514080 RepID=A0A2S6I1L6_9BACT|nr:hypothetical protein [Neolewinella xylanilytica]PPK85068.1 hypothetical protein CLV84_1958 [Neolewinella xylanilytica]